MGKKLIIKGADFSENGIIDVFQIGFKQGALNAIDYNTEGAIEPNTIAVYAKRMFTAHTLAVNPGETLTLLTTDSSLLVASICVYSVNINFPDATSERNRDYVSSCLSAEAYSTEVPAANYQYTNSGSAVVYVALTLKNTDNSEVVAGNYNLNYRVM